MMTILILIIIIFIQLKAINHRLRKTNIAKSDFQVANEIEVKIELSKPTKVSKLFVAQQTNVPPKSTLKQFQKEHHRERHRNNCMVQVR